MNLNFNFGGRDPQDDDYYERRRYNGTTVTLGQGGTKVFSIIFLIIGIIVLVFGIWSYATFAKKSETYLSTNGMVVEYKYSTSTDDYGNTEQLRAEVVDYRVDGETYTCSSKTYSSNAKSIGTTMEVKYNPEDPSDAYLAKDKGSWLIIAVGGTFTLVAGFMCITSFKK